MIDLSIFTNDPSVNLKPGDLIGLQLFGGFDYDGPCNPATQVGCQYNDQVPVQSLMGVFVGPSGFLNPGPLSTVLPKGTLIDDIPEDFEIPFWAMEYAQVPDTATKIELGPDDSWFKDNLDNNGDYQLWVKITLIQQYKIVRTILGKTNDDGSADIEPSTRACGKLPKNTYSKKISYQCINTITNEPASGCSVSLNLQAGANDGGHASYNHTSPRPLDFDNNLDFSGSSLPIPKEGLTVTYTAPEIAGSVDILATGADPNGHSLEVDKTTLNVRHYEHYQQISVPGLEVVVASHPGDGDYGTAKLQMATMKMMELYKKYSGETNPPILQSQGISLSWGGLFDIHDNWRIKHCGHRWGTAIDLSMNSVNLSAEEKKALERAAKKVGFEFRVPGEKPREKASDPMPDHWHGQIYH